MSGLWATILRLYTLVSTMAAFAVPSWADDLRVLGVEPPAHSLSVPVDRAIVVHFDKPVRRESLVSGITFWAFGRWSGTCTGTFEFSGDDQTVTLVPNRSFSAGESVTVILSHDIEATDGTALRDAGYSFQFWTETGKSGLGFAPAGVLSTLTDSEVGSRAYGGIASDLNRDGYVDLTIVNENTADLRVFLNRANGSVGFSDFMQPTFPVGNRASPSEPSDFDRDGIVDICVANINDGTVSVLLGRGDGTFAPQQVIVVGVAPRGIAVLDVDGDGDIDIVNTNFGSDNMSLLVNDGTGVFPTRVDFESGGDGEWALAAGDMNDDGILDLVVGTRHNEPGLQRIVVSLGNGDGTFTPASSNVSNGSVWMLVLGDLDGDGAEDVAAVNSDEDHGSILFGDGAGNLPHVESYPTDNFPLATDLGDMDGDGDLDWVTSSFGPSPPTHWFLFTNDGDGKFDLHEQFLAPRAASCALMLDLDSDGDLDLALIDERADVVLLMENLNPEPIPAVSGVGLVVLTLALATAAGVLLRRTFRVLPS